jgi:uroporphyrin-III C-methyltransferase
VSRKGIVYLIGAGPGAPDLITVRGRRCLRQAEVVIYDRLIDPSLLAEAPRAAERIFAGKATGCHAMAQAEINQLLVEQARAGRIVVRLKGGDPFVFGRGGEEAAACAEAGVPWEVVPGITSSVGVPACAGIPLTHRGVAAAFAVITGHCAPDLDDRVDWASLAGVDTLVALMGVQRLSGLAAVLMQHGRSPSTPTAIIERGTAPCERVVIGTLGDIAARALEAGVQPPAVLVIGEVVRLRAALLRGTSRYSDVERSSGTNG